MAEVTSSDFKKLIEAQQETTRQVMTAEERAADDARIAEQSRLRSEAARRGHETRLANEQNVEIETAEDSQDTAEDSEESEERSVGFLGRIANFMGLERLRGSAEAEEADDEESRGKKMLSFMQKSATFLGDITKQGYEKVKSGLSGFKKFAFGALAVAALAFLNSPKFEEIKNTILDVIIPAAAYLYDNVIKPIGQFLWEKVVTAFQDIRAVLDGKKGIFEALMNNKLVVAGIATFLVIKLLPLFKLLFTAVKGIVTAVSFLSKAGVFAKIAAGFAVVKGFFMTTLLPFVTAAGATLASVLIPIAAIANALYALKKGFDDFMFELEATGSVWEAVKSGIIGFVSNLFGFPLDLIKSGVSFILEKIGSLFGIESFMNASKAMDDFSFVDMFKDGLTFIGNAFAGLIDKIKNLAENMIRKIPVFGGKLADKIFGTKEEQAAAKKEAEEEQKRFEEQRKALREKQKLEKEAEEAKKIEAAKAKEEAKKLKVEKDSTVKSNKQLMDEAIAAERMKVDQKPAANKTAAISRRANPMDFSGGSPAVINAPTSVNNSPTTNVTQNSRSLAPTDRAMDQIAVAF